MPSQVKMRDLLETGVHFGHRTTKWNPKMDEFIFTARNGIHIIDLTQTLRNINVYFDMVRDIVSGGGTVMFVGTKRQAQEIIAFEAARCNMPYVNTRWLGGTLTNWRTVRASLDTMKKLEKDRDEGRFARLTKKEAMQRERKIQKLHLRLGGMRNMKKLPDMLIVVDTEREETAVKEANTLNVPVLGIVDTNANPDVIDYIVPANDDAMRSIRLLVKTFADAVIEGRAIRQGGGDVEEEELFEQEVVDYDDDASDEELLGASTLKKLRQQMSDDDDKPARASVGDDGDDDEDEDED
ncbi:MAG: 30S ribosomal protein S2 [Anaerolineae bacterium]|nr:30S ribosomal protein S2 [Anaerolineae bacterium]MCA9893248.1 30S ribosomal protein S2 [Anaerolineae bacterium]